MLRKVVDRAKQIRRSEGFKHSVAMPRRLSLHARQRLNRGVFSIEIQENSGFFSVMQMVLFILMYCDEKCLTPCISARWAVWRRRGETGLVLGFLRTRASRLGCRGRP